MTFMKLTFCLAVPFILLVARTSHGDIKGSTQQECYREMLEFNRDQMVHGYQTGGRRNPVWDAAATHALEVLATFSAQTTIEEISAFPLYPDAHIETAELAEAAQKAIDLGCDDPVVIYAKAVAMVDDGMTREARQWLAKADAGLKDTKYAPLLRFRIVYRRQRLAVDEKSSDELRQRVQQLAIEVASQKFINPAAQRECARTIIIALSALERKDFQKMLEEFSKELDFDSWILAELTAELELRHAEMERGTAWASDTAPQKMQEFEQLIARASAAAQEAFNLHPEFPESATMMINIKRDAGDTASARDWFARALEAQSDYGSAYSAIFMAMQPRWGGSVDQCMSIANHAAESDRYDTSAPYEYLLGILNVASDNYGGDKNAFKDPKVKQTAIDILNKYLARETQAYRTRYLRACLAALYAATDEVEPARKLLDQIPGDPPAQAFRLFNTYGPRVIEHVYLGTLSDPKGVADFRRASNRHFYKNAGNFLQEIIARDKPAGRTADILEQLKSGTDVMQKFAAGQTVSLLDETSRGFWDAESTYKIDPDGIRARPDDNFLLYSRFQCTDRHYAIHLEFEFDDVKATRDRHVSLGWGLNDNYVGWSISLTGDPAGAVVQVPDSDQLDKNSTIALPISDKNTVDIEYFDGAPSVKVNGKNVPMDFGDKSLYEKFKPANRIMLSTYASVRFTAMTLRHLSSKP